MMENVLKETFQLVEFELKELILIMCFPVRRDFFCQFLQYLGFNSLKFGNIPN